MIVNQPAPDIHICSIETDAELLQLGEWLGRHRDEVLGVDAETNSRDPFDPLFALRCVQISDGHTAFNINPTTVDIRYLAHLIRRHRWWVAHYAENEVRFLSQGLPGSVRLDEDVPHIADSQTALAWFDPRTVTSQDEAYGKIPLEKGLKPTALRELPDGHLLTEAEDARDRMAAAMAPKGVRKQEEQRAHWFAHVPWDHPTYQVYAGLDAVMVKRLWDKTTTAIRARGQWQGFTLDVALQWHIDRATRRGLLIDGPYARWLDGELERVLLGLAPKLLEHGVPMSGMGKSVGAAFERMGAESTKISRKTQAPSWDKFVLADLAKRDGEVGVLAATIIAARKAGKFRTTYVKPMLDALTRDGWMRCSMRAVGTITSRQSASKPPIQQLPKKDTRVRAAICAPEGWVLVSCDLSQGEPRTMAGLSGDRNLLADILSGDLNSAVAAQVYGAQFDAVQAKITGTPSYLMRQGAKAAFLAWCYGATDPKLAETLAKDQAPGVAPITAAPSAAWSARYPDLARFKADQDAGHFVTLENGWVAPLWDRAWHEDDGTPAGRIRWGYRHSRKGLNYATQGNQRQLLARAVHEIVRRGWSWAISMLVHDEILLCVPAWMAPQAAVDLQAAMTMDFHGVPIEAEATICGRTWTAQPEEFDMRELEHVEV